MGTEREALDPVTMEWREVDDFTRPDGVHVRLGMTRDGRMWEAPLGTAPSTRYPPDLSWRYVGKVRDEDRGTEPGYPGKI